MSSFLNPSGWRDPVRALITRFVREVAAEVRPGEYVLDAGAGECAYRSLFNHAHYESADAARGDASWNYQEVTFRCDLRRLPVEDGRYDHVLCTQTLEHVDDPLAVLREIHRVLKPGGSLWLSVPFGQSLHQEPYDYFRFTLHGLNHLFASAGFQVLWIHPCGGAFIRLSCELSYLTEFVLLPWNRALSFPVRALVALARWVLVRMDFLDHAKRHTMNYVCHVKGSVST